MKFGVREICDVVLRAKHKIKIGKYDYEKDMPVLYFDSLKTSSLEGAATTVYAQGGRGNTRLIAWEGEKTITFTMEDALISKESLAALSGAGVVDASDYQDGIPIHTVEKTTMDTATTFKLEQKPWEDKTQGGDVHTYIILLDDHGDIAGVPHRLNLKDVGEKANGYYPCTLKEAISEIEAGAYVLIDYYVQQKTKATELQITADKFAGNYYLEASTLFRNKNGEDLPAEFIIPNCKIQSNFTLSMAPTGDPSTFTFTMDAFPDYTKYNKKTKVLAAIQIIEDGLTEVEDFTEGTSYNASTEVPSAGRFQRSNSILNNEN